MTDMVKIWRDGKAVEMTREEAGLPPVKPPTRDDVQAHAEDRLAALVAAYRPLQRETWEKQEAQARAYLADKKARTRMLDRLLRDGEDKGALAAYIVAQADALEDAAGAILGKMRELCAMDPIPADYTDDKWWP